MLQCQITTSCIFARFITTILFKYKSDRFTISMVWFGYTRKRGGGEGGSGGEGGDGGAATIPQKIKSRKK